MKGRIRNMKGRIWKLFWIVRFLLLLILVGVVRLYIRNLASKTKIMYGKTYVKEGLDGINEQSGILEGIDRIYWINLDRSPDRRELMETMFAQPVFSGIAHTRFSAVDGKKVDVFAFLDSSEKKNPRLNNVEYACLLSHLKTIEMISNAPDEQVALVMEDDMTLEFQPYWKKSIREILNAAPEDWEVIQLCYIGYIPETDYEPWYYHFSTGAYLINQKGAQKCMQLMENGVFHLYKHPNPPYVHADSFLFSYLKTYCYRYPMFIYKDSNDSLLHAGHMEDHQKSKDRIIEMYRSQ